MTNSAQFEAVPLGGRYAVSLAAATTAAGIAGLSFGLAQHVDGQKAETLLWTAAIAAAISAGLTVDAMKRWLRSRRRSPRSSGKPAASIVFPRLPAATVLAKLPAQLKRLALPAPAWYKSAPQTPPPRAEAKAQTAREAPRPDPRGSAESERDRLRKQGFSEAEISQILVAREAGGHGGHGASLGSGFATGLLNNLGAVAAYVRAFLPGLKADVLLLFDGAASAGIRGGAAMSLAFKAVAISVVAYIAVLEFEQLRAIVAKTKAEACSARMKMIAETLPMHEWSIALRDYNRDCAPR